MRTGRGSRRSGYAPPAGAGPVLGRQCVRVPPTNAGHHNEPRLDQAPRACGAARDHNLEVSTDRGGPYRITPDGQAIDQLSSLSVVSSPGPKSLDRPGCPPTVPSRLRGASSRKRRRGWAGRTPACGYRSSSGRTPKSHSLSCRISGICLQRGSVWRQRTTPRQLELPWMPSNGAVATPGRRLVADRPGQVVPYTEKAPVVEINRSPTA